MAVRELGRSVGNPLAKASGTPVRGESVFAIPGTYTWVCPVGVTSVSVLVVGGGGSGYTAGEQAGGLSRATFGATVVTANGGAASSTAPNAGGTATGGDANFTGGTATSKGGGGAAGYAGNGGNGGSAGTGGSGGGGDDGTYGSGGGGVGIFGLGSSGAVGSAVDTTGGGGGSGGQTALYSHAGSFGGGGGGGLSASYRGGGGGGLAYKNNVTVTPGTSYTIITGLGGRTTQANGATNGKGGDGVVRIIWPGATRLFPSTDVGTP